MNSASEISKALGGKRLSQDNYKAPCVCHDEKTPSMSIRQRGDKVLLYCFGCGAGFREIVPELEKRGLWTSTNNPQWREKARERRKQEEIEQCRIFIQVYEAPKNAKLRRQADHVKYQQCKRILG